MPRRLVREAFEYELFLLLGTAAALIWANLAPRSYRALVEAELFAGLAIGTPTGTGPRVVNVHFVIADGLMAFFFALAAAEVWRALLPGGILGSRRRAATPLICAAGGMIAPALIYLLGSSFVEPSGALSHGWAIPTATDVAFSYVVTRAVFGGGHPAVLFLLMLAIADDAAGLVILAVAYPEGERRLSWLLLTAAAVALALLMRRLGARSFWWYLAAPGTLSWLGVDLAGLQPALGLIPIIPAMPHRVSKEEAQARDRPPAGRAATLDKFIRQWEKPVSLILGLFGLASAGVPVRAWSPLAWLVLAALVIGKPAGIWLSGLLSVKALRLDLPRELPLKNLLVVGLAAAIGFTVSIFLAEAAFAEGPALDAAKLGALGSLSAALPAWILARAFRVRRIPEEPDS